MSMPVTRRLVLAIFVLSGAAGLIYEVVWSRQLVLVFGNTTQAVSAILTGFFAGMALGNAFGGRLADRVRRPLRLYGLLEVSIAVIATLTPLLFRLSLEVYRGAFGVLEEHPTELGLVRFALALVALAPATVLLGATLPTLTRYLARGALGLSGSFAGLYSANTLGAVAGAAVSGFVLIELFGLTGALLCGAACSAIAGALALVIDAWTLRAEVRVGTAGATGDRFLPGAALGRADGPGAAAAAPSGGARRGVRPRRSGPASSSAVLSPRLRLALAFAFVSGLTSLGYQTLWTRLLASGTGNSTYVFSFILVVFLSGLAIGAAAYAIGRRYVTSPLTALALSQAAIGLLAVWGLASVIGHPPPMTIKLDDIDGVWGQLWPQVLLVVLPPTIVMGFALPAASALLDATDHTVAGRTGLLLGVNTLGSIVGTFVIPFFVIPALGSPTSVAVLAAFNLATAAVLVVAAGPSRRVGRPVATVAVGLAALAVAFLSFSPGALRDPGVARIELAGGKIYQSTEDEIASVQAGVLGGGQQLWVTGTSMTLLTVDTRMMPVLSLALRPQSTHALVIAFGQGSAFRSALQAGLDTDVVELVPSVPEMFHWFFGDANQVLANPRGRVIVADGRNYVELTDKRYDIINVDPPPPIYSAGVSVISSREFYQAAKARLNPGGVMMQWVPYGERAAEYKAEVRTYASVFPHVLVVRGPGGYGTYMFGSDQPLAFTEAGIRSAMSRPGVVPEVSSAFDAPAHTLDGWVAKIPSLVWLDDAGARSFAGSGPLLTDDHPLQEYFLIRHMTEPK